MPPIDQPSHPTADALAYQTYYVVAGDMSTRNHEGLIQGCQMVLVSAQDSYEACDVALNALEAGLAPIAAFDRADLLHILDTLARHALRPGESYNLDHLKTDAEMTAMREECRNDMLDAATGPQHEKATSVSDGEIGTSAILF